MAKPGINRADQSTILIVDDHSAIREGLKAALHDSKEFTVVGEAADAEQALSLVQALRPAIVVLDISIPGRSGITVAEEIRRLSETTRVVVYTMHAEMGLQAGMTRAGVSAYVLKGEPLSDLLQALRMTRDGKKRFPHAPAATESASAEGEQLSGREAEDLRALSQREKEIFLMLAEGRSIKQAAFDLGLSPKSVETYKYRLMRKLNVSNVVDLARLAIRSRLVKP
ncbi:MAG: response regulator transcription factor [Spirochaetia bacterium]|jgi:DNA-binding NarL/FixJ family response regulator